MLKKGRKISTISKIFEFTFYINHLGLYIQYTLQTDTYGEISSFMLFVKKQGKNSFFSYDERQKIKYKRYQNSNLVKLLYTDES